MAFLQVELCRFKSPCQMRTAGKTNLEPRLSLFFGPDCSSGFHSGKDNRKRDKINPKIASDWIGGSAVGDSREVVHVRTGLMGRDGLGWADPALETCGTAAAAVQIRSCFIFTKQHTEPDAALSLGSAGFLSRERSSQSKRARLFPGLR